MIKSSTHKGHTFGIAIIIAILAIVLLEGVASASTNYTQVTIIVDKNNINLHSKEDVIVDILSSVAPQFNATTINISSVKFMGAPAKNTGNPEFDVNNDGLKDLKLHFDLQDTSIQCGGESQWVILTGKTKNETEIFGLSTIQILNCTASPPGALNITGFAPLSPVNDSIGATRLFNITVNQIADVFWMINGNLVKEPDSDSHVNESNYTNYSASFGIWNVTALAINITYFNGTDIPLFTLSDSHNWDWNVSKINTIISVTSSINPSVSGQSVNFTATVSTVTPGAGIPKGTMQFKIDGSNFGLPVGLSNGSATSIGNSSLSVGTHIITAEYNGDGNFSSNTSSPLIQTVSKATATITLVNLTQTYTGSPLMPTATTNPSDLSIEWTGAPQTNAGSYPVIATINDTNYEGSASDTFNITKATAIITLGNLDQVYDGNPKPVTATTDSAGLTGVSITYNGSSTAPTDAGSYDVVATLTNDNYSASNANGTLIISKASQTITFNALSNKTYGDAPFNVSAISSSGLPVSFTASGECSVSGNNVTITEAGICTITANQSGNANYNPAPDLSQSFNIIKASQIITFNALADKTYGDAPFNVNATASSGLPVSFTTFGTCTVANNNITITGAGICTITASQSGDASYNPAPNVSQTFNITKAQLIITADDKSRAYGNANPTLTGEIEGVKNDDGITATYSTTADVDAAVGTYNIVPAAVDSDPSTLGNYDITLVNGNLTITKAETTTSLSSSINPSVSGQSVNFTATVSTVTPGAGIPNGTMQFKIDGSNFGLPVGLSNGSATSIGNSSLSVGTHTIIAEYSGDSNFNYSTSSTLIQTVNKAPTIPTTTTSSSAGSSTGSSRCGSGVITKENLLNIKQYETREVNVHISGGVTVFNFSTLGIVNKAGFTAKTNEGCIAVRGEVLKERPSQAASGAPGTDAVYFNVWLGSWGYGESSKIENPYVVFSVPDEKNNESVKLMMYENKSWIDLKTEKIDTGTYRAYTRGFGSFAIVETAADETPAETLTQSTPTPVVITNEPATQKPTNWALIMIVFILISCMIIGYRQYRKGSSRKKTDLQK